MAKILHMLLSPKKCNHQQEKQEIDIKSGKIFLIQNYDKKQQKHKIYMKVFRNTYEHHAQMYSDSDYKFMYGYISMRSCKVSNKPGTNAIIISNNKKIMDSKTGNEFIFEVENSEDVSGWMEALTPNDLPLHSELSPGASTFGRSNFLCPLKEGFNET